MRVSIVIPVFNEASSLELLLPEVRQVMDRESWDYSVIVVDDGSTDSTTEVAREHGSHVIKSGRNLGKAAALQAGFDAASDAEVVVTLDGDLQDDPGEIPRLIKELETVDMVNGWKVDRRDSLPKKVQSRLFTWLVRVLSGIDLHDFNCGLKAYRRGVLDVIHVYGEQHRLIPVLAVNAGFAVRELPVNHRERRFGQSKYSWTRMFRGPLDLITVLFLSRFGHRPLHVFGLGGVVLGGIGVLIGLYLSWLRIVEDAGIGDRPLLLLAVLLMLVGVQLFAVGLLGEMMLSTRGRGGPSPYRAVTSWPRSGAPEDVQAFPSPSTSDRDDRSQR